MNRAAPLSLDRRGCTQDVCMCAMRRSSGCTSVMFELTPALLSPRQPQVLVQHSMNKSFKESTLWLPELWRRLHLTTESLDCWCQYPTVLYTLHETMSGLKAKPSAESSVPAPGGAGGETALWNGSGTPHTQPNLASILPSPSNQPASVRGFGYSGSSRSQPTFIPSHMFL